MITHDFREVFAVDIHAAPDQLRWKKRKMLKVLREIYEMDVAFISRFEGTKRLFDEVDLAATNLPFTLERGMAGPLQDSYCYRVAENMVPNLIIDARQESGVADIQATFDWPIGAHVSVPITLSSGATYGMLCAFSRQKDPKLSRRDLSMFTLCADLLARDIENSLGSDAAKSAMTAMTDLLQNAIANRQFRFYLQPIVSLPDRRVTGHELLTRFPPDIGRTEEIFNSARTLELLPALEAVIAREAHVVLDRLPQDLSLSINFSVGSIEELDFAAIFAARDRSRIIIEITEHERVNNYGTFALAVERLRALGFRLAIDDVGAGYSSFRHVIQLKPDIIKIDRSLISGIDHSAERGSLATALQDYAALHNARIVAEGVETLEELAKVEALHIPFAQGYALGRPAPADEVL